MWAMISRAGRTSHDATANGATEGSAVRPSATYTTGLLAAATGKLSSGPASGSGDGHGLDPGCGLSSPGSRGDSASSSDDRGRPDSPAKYHLRGEPPSAPTLSYMVQGNAPTANAPTAYAPQQIFMANAPQPTANAPQPVAMAPQPPAMAPQPVQMAMAPQPQPVAMAPQPQPVAMAPQPQPVAMAPQPQPVAMAPQVGQSPALLAAVLTNPSLFNRLVGAFGEHLAQRRNPRIQMGQAPQIMQAPVGNAPVGNAPAGGLAYAPLGYGGEPPMMGFLAVPAGGGQPPAYGYGYGYGPPPGPGYYPPPGYGNGPPPGQGYPPYPPQGPPEYPSYPPGPPPVAPTPQGYNQGSWNSSQNWRPQQPSTPQSQSHLKSLLDHFRGE